MCVKIYNIFSEILKKNMDPAMLIGATGEIFLEIFFIFSKFFLFFRNFFYFFEIFL